QTPDAVVKVLHDTFKKGMEDPKFVEFMNKGGFGIGYKSADELSKYIVQQDAMFKPLIEQAGLLKK
ncbi:MAG: Tripartite tricarboxylate transporter family receptor, partial [Anaerosporomusa subterranea]|nr:Tripartite tricarboxylate transporter family receptor [Anaerosporomusa subterranea]